MVSIKRVGILRLDIFTDLRLDFPPWYRRVWESEDDTLVLGACPILSMECMYGRHITFDFGTSTFLIETGYWICISPKYKNLTMTRCELVLRNQGPGRG